MSLNARDAAVLEVRTDDRPGVVFLACRALAALGLAVFWLETVPEKLDAALLVFAVTAIALPSLLVADGQYLAFLRLGLNGTWPGVFLAHLTQVFAYVFIVLKGPYRAFDPRYRAVLSEQAEEVGAA